MNPKTELRELETELYTYYQASRGVTPNNTFTQGMWRRIDTLIAEVES